MMIMMPMMMKKMTLFDQQSQQRGSDVRERKRSPFIPLSRVKVLVVVMMMMMVSRVKVGVMVVMMMMVVSLINAMWW